MLSENISLILLDRHVETIDTISFYFQTKNLLPIQFKPGQFVLLDIKINGVSFVRAYSISSQPNSNIIQLTVKRIENGLVSNWLIDHLQQKHEITIQAIEG